MMRTGYLRKQPIEVVRVSQLHFRMTQWVTTLLKQLVMTRQPISITKKMLIAMVNDVNIIYQNNKKPCQLQGFTVYHDCIRELKLRLRTTS